MSRRDARGLIEDSVELSTIVQRVATLLDISGPIVSAPGELLAKPTPTTEVAVEITLGADAVSPAQITVPTVPPEIRQHVTEGFSGFIGNRAAVDGLKRSILKALLSTPPQLPAS